MKDVLDLHGFLFVKFSDWLSIWFYIVFMTIVLSHFFDAFPASNYFNKDPDGETMYEVMFASVTNALRIMYLSMMVFVADARIPTSALHQLLKILVSENGYSWTTLTLR